MSWHEFVFSEKPAKRLVRHILFWLTWWLYFSLCDYIYQQPLLPMDRSQPVYVTLGDYLFFKTALLILVYAVACYFFIYAFMPQFIKGKWLSVSFIGILLSIFLFITTLFMYWTLFPFIDFIFGSYKPSTFPTRFWPAFYLGLINPTKVVATAGIIKYVKYWWLKQKESEKINHEKINAEIQLLKTQIRPGFLFNALNNIYVYSLAASPRAPEMLLKLSDLLSYMLYECDQPLVPLKKEIDIMKDYMALEKIRLGESLEMEFNVVGDLADKKIAPFLLLPFIENSFKHSNNPSENSWVNMDITVEGNSFYMKLANGIMSDSNSIPSVDKTWLVNVQKRLNLLYPQKHDLKISMEEEMLILFLKIRLDESAIVKPGTSDYLIVPETITFPDHVAQ